MGRRAFSRAAITSRLFNTPLAATAEVGMIVLGAVGRKLDVSQLFVGGDGERVTLGDLSALSAERVAELKSRTGIDQRAPLYAASDLMPVIEGVAFIEIRGELVAENDGAISPQSGFTGYDGIMAKVKSADADAGVRGIILDIDSPGGEVLGLYECVGSLMARRGTKPMRAVIRGCGASAACAVSICADPGEVTITDLGYGCSIGTIMMHVDYSKSLASEGIDVTLIMSGSHKADGNPFQPLPDEVRTRLQSLCDQANDRFIAHVVAARGIDEESVRAQQAQVFRGQEVVDAGIADKVMTWADSIAEFTAQVNAPASPGTGGIAGRSARPAPGARSSMEKNMDIEGTAPAGITPEDHQTAVTAASANAVTAERSRIAGLQAIAGDGNKVELEKAIAEGTEPGAFAVALRKGEEAKAAAALAGAQDDAAKPDILPAKAADTTPGAKVNRGQAYADAKKAKAAK
jgi:ClpP class serine protease